jgi:hypothetical protein
VVVGVSVVVGVGVIVGVLLGVAVGVAAENQYNVFPESVELVG